MSHISSHVIIDDAFNKLIVNLRSFKDNKEHFENLSDEQKEKIQKAVEKANEVLEGLDRP